MIVKTRKDIIVLIGAGQIGMAIARRLGNGKKILVADWKLENANTITNIMKEAGFDAVPFEVYISSKLSVVPY